MARNGPGGSFYSTEDLMKMARLNQFGNYSPVLFRALSKLRVLEIENTKLRNTLEEYERIDEIKEEYTGSDNTTQADQVDLEDLYNNY